MPKTKTERTRLAASFQAHVDRIRRGGRRARTARSGRVDVAPPVPVCAPLEDNVTWYDDDTETLQQLPFATFSAMLPSVNTSFG